MATNHAIDPGDGITMVDTPMASMLNANPAAGGIASVVAPVAPTGQRNVCHSISVSIAAAAAPQTPLTVVLRDDDTGVGTILWSAVLAAPANQCAGFFNSYMNIIGTPGKKMTLEFTGAPVGTALEAVSLGFYTAIK
jgi:hypothetical protein